MVLHIHEIRVDILRVAWYFPSAEGARKSTSNEQNVRAYYTCTAIN